MSQLHPVRRQIKRKILRPVSHSDLIQNLVEGKDGAMLDSQHLLISLLIPPSVKAFYEELEGELKALCGDRYSREGEVSRHGSQPGSIILGNQRVAVQRPRVRGKDGEVPMATYARFQDPSLFDEQVFAQGLKHVSQRDYEKGLPQIAASFGVSKSTVSRSWVKTTAKQVDALLNRGLKPLDIIAVFIDGKRFSALGVVVALGISSNGSKYVLGVYQSSTENSAACIELLNDLERRGLAERDLLFVVDGGSGLNKALNDKYQCDETQARRAIRVRCFVHKWRNISDVLDEQGKQEAAPLYWAIRDAKDLSEAQSCSEALEGCLKQYNVSALNSYFEAKTDLLAIHRLGIGSQLKRFFSTTNPIESLNSLLEEDLRRVKRWRDSSHFQRWMACACLNNEKRMRKIRGYRGLVALKVRLQKLSRQEIDLDSETFAA
jgi:putative transposase